jgi:hypothetical protein
MKIILLIQSILLVTFLSCASMDYSNIGYELNSDNTPTNNEHTKLGLKISAEEDEKLESEYFGVINFSFVNSSQEWIYIKNIKLDFGSDLINNNVRIISGRDILAWKESTILRNKIDEYNMNLFLGSLAVTGAMLSTSGNTNIKTAGNTLLLGSLASLTVKEISDSYNKIQYSSIFPTNHLLNGDFIIPPGLFIKKWIVLNTKNHKETGMITQLDIEYQTTNSITEKVRIILNERLYKTKLNGATPPIWQETYYKESRGKIY